MKVIKKTKSPYSPVKGFKIRSPLISRILIGLLLLLLISIFVDIGLVVFLVVAISFNAALEKFRLKRGLPTDFELSTISTVIVTRSFGLQWGLVTAVLSKLITSISTGNLLPDHFFMIATYMNAALITALFSGANIFVLGISIVVINNIIMFLISKNVLQIPVTENLSYTVSNFIFNFLMFSIFSELITNILG